MIADRPSRSTKKRPKAKLTEQEQAEAVERLLGRLAKCPRCAGIVPLPEGRNRLVDCLLTTNKAGQILVTHVFDK